MFCSMTFFLSLYNFWQLLGMDLSGFAEPTIATIVPTASSTSRVEYISSTSRIFVKFEDSSSSTFSRKCASQWLNSSVSTLFVFFSFYDFFVLYVRYLRAPSTPWMSGKPQAWARRQQSEATFPNPLRSLQISCRHWRPALASPDPLDQIAFLKDVSLQ